MDVHARFPRLAQLGAPLARAIPFVQQLEWADCGAASLAMVLGYHGKHLDLDRVRTALSISRDGVSARAILDGAAQLGLAGRALKVDLDDLAELPRATILHWDLSHYVVFDRVIGDVVRIVDPATGERDVTWDEVSRCFTGVALELVPRADFAKEKAAKGHAAKTYLRELFAEKALFARVVTVSLVMRLFALVLPLVTGLVIDWVVPRADLDMLWVVLGSVVGILGLQAVCTLMRAHLLLSLRTTLDGRITLGFLDHLVSLPIGFFQRRSAGDLMMRVGSNATIRELITSQTLAAVIDGVFVATYAIVIFAVSAQLGVLAVGLATVEILLWFAVRPKNRRYLSQDIERQAKAQSYLVQMLAGMETLKCAGAESGAVERYSNLYADCLDMSIKRGRLAGTLEAFHSTMAQLAPMVILAVGAHAVITGSLSLGTMLAMSTLATSLFGPLTNLVQSLVQLQVVRTYAERIEDVRRAAPERDPEKVYAAPALAGGVSLSHVSLRYGDGPLVVDDVSLDIKPGMSVALVGPSGSGKTSLLNLIAGTVTPVKGVVKFDGRALGELDVRAVRQQIGIVPQHPYIFGASLRENIALTAPEASVERIQRAAATAALDADIAKMPMGLDTVVSDGGASLSGGQRQRIALARAVLREPCMLLLDEATSALDTATEARVTGNLRALCATRVVVAHRLSTVANADLIVVMDKGKIVETGTHAALLGKPNSLYRKLVAAAGGPLPALPAQETAHVAAKPAPKKLPAGPAVAAGAGGNTARAADKLRS
jgi:ABC-type bacteriocin/lantibiotic exporter with double-glycine peptidase domain|nr:peptidase domain-containing ABC transporter [Kofleriaceae bacterium]